MISAIYLILRILQETIGADGLLIMDVLLFKLARQDYTSTLAHAAHAYTMMVLSFGCMTDRWLSLACIYGSSSKQRRVLCMFAQLKAKDGKQHAYWLQTLASAAAYARAGTGRWGGWQIKNYGY
jgi:hypothetical protein